MMFSGILRLKERRNSQKGHLLTVALFYKIGIVPEAHLKLCEFLFYFFVSKNW